MRPRLVVALLLFVFTAQAARADPRRFEGTIQLLTSFGVSIAEVPLLTAPISGTANVTGSTVRIPAGQIQAPLPPLLGFAGTLVNGPGTFSPGGAGPGSVCPLSALQEVCIEGGGFGGSMRLVGASQIGQPLLVWGSEGTATDMTTTGLSRVEQALPWTSGHASAWFYVLETDITPFAIMDVGTFRGLLGADPGFSIVAPMVVTADEASSAHNLRTMARIRIDLGPPSVPLGASGLLAGALVTAGAWALQRRRKADRTR